MHQNHTKESIHEDKRYNEHKQKLLEAGNYLGGFRIRHLYAKIYLESFEPCPSTNGLKWTRDVNRAYTFRVHADAFDFCRRIWGVHWHNYILVENAILM